MAKVEKLPDGGVRIEFNFDERAVMGYALNSLVTLVSWHTEERRKFRRKLAEMAEMLSSRGAPGEYAIEDAEGSTGKSLIAKDFIG